MDRRAHYLVVALGLFTEHGYRGVSIDQLVAAAGGSKATLYRYFPSKEAVFEAIIDDLAHATLPPEADLDPSTVPLTDGLRRLGTGIAAAALNDQVIAALRLAIGEQHRFPDLARILFERGPARSYQRFATFLRSKEDLGEVDLVDADADVAAEQFISGIVGHQQLRMALGISAPTPADITARVDAAVHAFVMTYAAG